MIPAPRPGDQPNPTSGVGPDIQPLVIADLQARYELGKARYGTGLKAFNGRDGLRDLYEELMDAIMYTRQIMEEDTVGEMSDEDCTCGREAKGRHRIACPLYVAKPSHRLHSRARNDAVKDLIEMFPGQYWLLYNGHVDRLRAEAKPE